MSIGRNDPCPCASGKKYKKCCLVNSQAQKVEDLCYRRLRETENQLISRLFRHAAEVFGPTSIEEAWVEFHCWEYSEKYDPKDPINQIFSPFFLFCWEIGLADTSCDLSLEGKTVAESFLAANRSRLSSDEIKIIERANRSVFSFHEVTDVTPGHGFTLRNVLTEDIFEVIEHSGSKGAQRGDIIFAALFELSGRHQILALSPYLFPPLVIQSLIEIRKALLKSVKAKKLTDTHVSDFDIEVRHIYFTLLEPVLNPKMPELCNTDGDPFVPQTLHFEIDDLESAYKGLRSLALGFATDDELRAEAKFRDGRMIEVEIPWFKKDKSSPGSASNIVLGGIRIVGTKLTVDVNSNQRATAIKKKILSCLGSQVRFKAKVIESIEGNMERVPPSNTSKSPANPLDQLPPEALETVKKMADAHWAKWFDEKIPALNNKTPNQAAKSKEGRELLEALLNFYEQRSDQPNSENTNLCQPDIGKLRAKLGLAQER